MKISVPIEQQCCILKVMNREDPFKLHRGSGMKAGGIRGIDVKKPPLVADRGQTRGFLIKWSDTKNDNKKISENMIFELFRTFKIQKRNSAFGRKKIGTNKGRVSYKRGFLNFNTPDQAEKRFGTF